jgi:hypothetical protein
VSKFRIKLALAVAVIAAAVITSAAIATRGGGVKQNLSGYEEVPLTLSTPASGKFRAFVDPANQKITYKLRYGGFESDVTQAHIHFGARATSGGISVWLCANNPPITSAPAGTQACPKRSGTIAGEITPASVVGPAAQGIAAGEFGELLAALRAGATYVNVHSEAFPPGEVRAQIAGGWGGKAWSGKNWDDDGDGRPGKGWGRGHKGN